MKPLLDFKTTLDRETIIKILKENTFATQNDFQTLLFDKRYFSGQVNDKKIRIKNATRRPRNPSPILDITISQKGGFNEITVQDDTEDEIRTNNLMIQTITISIAVVVLLTGGTLFFVQPHSYSLLWPVTVSFIIAAWGFVNAYYYRERVRLNTRQDVDFLVRLLKPQNDRNAVTRP